MLLYFFTAARLFLGGESVVGHLRTQSIFEEARSFLKIRNRDAKVLNSARERLRICVVAHDIRVCQQSGYGSGRCLIIELKSEVT
nr:hypothetical protein [uncultured Corynebacterium sp.]